MKAARFDYIRPQSISEAIAALGSDGARLLSGGQSLGPMLNLRLARPSILVDVSRLQELRHAEATANGVMFGAALTHAEFEDGVLPDPTGGILAGVARGIAYRAIRNRGTIGGSIAHADPAADWPTTLAALGGSVRVEGPGGERRVPVEAFMVAAFETVLVPQEMVTGVFVPTLSKRARWGYWKACRKVGEFAEGMAAVFDDPAREVFRIVIGATESRLIVVSGSTALKRYEDALDEAGLGADPAEFSLHRSVVRRAIQAMDREPLYA